MLRSRIYLSLPLKHIDAPKGAYFIEIAAYLFDTGMQVGDQFEIENWYLAQSSSPIQATAAIIKRSINVIPSERDNLGNKVDVLEIALYAEIADKERINEICQSLKIWNPGMFLED